MIFFYLTSFFSVIKGLSVETELLVKNNLCHICRHISYDHLSVSHSAEPSFCLHWD